MTDTAAIFSSVVVAALLLAFIALFRLLATMISHRTIRRAVDSDPKLAESVVQKLTERKERSADDRLALVLVAIGIAMAVAPIIAIDDKGIVRFALAASLFPLLVGATLWLRYRAVERARRRDRAE